MIVFRQLHAQNSIRATNYALHGGGSLASAGRRDRGLSRSDVPEPASGSALRGP